MADPLLNEIEVSRRLRVSVACVRRWRLERRGPRYVKVGSLVRYRDEDVERWLGALPGGGQEKSAEAKQTEDPKDSAKSAVA